MEAVQFTLQIEMFSTVDDSWEKMDSFWCVFNEGFFKDLSNGYCNNWIDEYHRIGKVVRNDQNLFNVVSLSGNVFRTLEDALNAIQDK